MSTPTPETPPERPDDTLSNDQNGTADERVDGAPLNSKPVDETGVEEVPPTDVSLISGNNKPRHYKADNPSFFMQRGYQVLLVLGLIAAFFLVMVYQTLFGRIEQPQQMVTIEKGQTYYGLLPQWQQEIPLFSATIAKLYMKTQVDGPLHAGIYQLPENPTIAEALHVLGQGVKAAMVKVQIIEGKTSKDLYQALRDNKGIKKEVLTADSTNASIAEALDLVGILPDAVANSNDPIVNHNL